MSVSDFVVKIQARFESAHFLRAYRGVAEPMHGHSYLAEAEIAGPEGGLDEDDLAIDFVVAKRELERLAAELHYRCINDVAPFDRINPSAENIARWFHEELTRALSSERAIIRAVTIWEGPTNSVRYEVKG